MIPKLEDLTYPERAHLHQVDPELYRALKASFERRAAAEIRRGILTRDHLGWLHRETTKAGQEQYKALLGLNEKQC